MFQCFNDIMLQCFDETTNTSFFNTPMFPSKFVSKQQVKTTSRKKSKILLEKNCT